jgi:hypothetical protein
VARFYETHDSILNSTEREAEHQIVSLEAIRMEVINSSDSKLKKMFRQEIKLIIEQATLEVDSANLPNWLLDGHFKYANLIANSDNVIEDQIPVSLVSARDAQLRPEGMNEDTRECISISIRGSLVTIQALGDPVFIQENALQD